VPYEFETFMQRLDIERRCNALINPHCKGCVERLNRVIKEYIACQVVKGKMFAGAVRTVLEKY